jgi:hypothetical protein
MKANGSTAGAGMPDSSLRSLFGQIKTSRRVLRRGMGTPLHGLSFAIATTLTRGNLR